MPQKKLNPTNWAALLQAEIATRGTKFPPGAKSIPEIRADRKAAGLPWGESFTRRWLRELVGEGQARVIDGFIPSKSTGSLVKATRYLLK